MRLHTTFYLPFYTTHFKDCRWLEGAWMPWILDGWLVTLVEEVDLMAMWNFSERFRLILPASRVCLANPPFVAAYLQGRPDGFISHTDLFGSFSYLTHHPLSNDLEEQTRQWFSGIWKLSIASFTALGFSLAGAWEGRGFNHPLPLLLALLSPELAAIVRSDKRFTRKTSL